MMLQMVGCHHEKSGLEACERLALSPEQTEAALMSWREAHPETEAVLLSTCNRVEFYAAGIDDGDRPAPGTLVRHLAQVHEISFDSIASDLISLSDEQAVHHLFRVAASIDSMVVGEPQILAQVKQAYELACKIGSAGPLTHQFFQAALRTARRVANETSLHRHRVSIPSVAIADFACRIFEQFDDKRVLVIGAGEMAEETLRYLVDAGARNLHVVNRNFVRAELLAGKWLGKAADWTDLHAELAAADVVISTSGAEQPIVSLPDYRSKVAPHRQQRPIFVLDLAMPRDFDPAIGNELGTFLYSTGDLAEACQRNRSSRAAELPAAAEIVRQEAATFLAESRHRATGPVIAQLREGFEQTQQEELARLFRKLPDLDSRARSEVQRFADRLVGKLLHPPLESLRDESQTGSPRQLLDALRRLFQLNE